VTKLQIRRDALEKIVDAFERLLIELPRDPSDRERTMLQWFREFLSDDVSPLDRVTRQVATLKPGWDRPMTAMEEHHLHGAMDTLTDFTDGEWQTIRNYLAYKPKSYEKLFQVSNRNWFLENPVNTLTAAETWRDANRAIEPRKKPVNEPVGNTLSKEEMLAILRGED